MKENIAAYGEISHHTINASKNRFGIEENIAHGQVSCSMLRNDVGNHAVLSLRITLILLCVHELVTAYSQYKWSQNILIREYINHKLPFTYITFQYVSI